MSDEGQQLLRQDLDSSCGRRWRFLLDLENVRQSHLITLGFKIRVIHSTALRRHIAKSQSGRHSTFDWAQPVALVGGDQQNFLKIAIGQLSFEGFKYLIPHNVVALRMPSVMHSSKNEFYFDAIIGCLFNINFVLIWGSGVQFQNLWVVAQILDPCGLMAVVWLKCWTL